MCTLECSFQLRPPSLCSKDEGHVEVHPSVCVPFFRTYPFLDFIRSKTSIARLQDGVCKCKRVRESHDVSLGVGDQVHHAICASSKVSHWGSLFLNLRCWRWCVTRFLVDNDEIDAKDIIHSGQFTDRLARIHDGYINLPTP